jgi:hypothetical protein
MRHRRYDGRSPSPTPVSGVSKAATISADYFGACVLNTDGSVQCWGSVLGDGSTAPTTSTVYVTGIRGLCPGVSFPEVSRHGPGAIR